MWCFIGNAFMVLTVSTLTLGLLLIFIGMIYAAYSIVSDMFYYHTLDKSIRQHRVSMVERIKPNNSEWEKPNG